MYVPQHFAMSDDEVSALLATAGAADLVTAHHRQGRVELVATPLPFVHDPSVGEHGALLGHVARNNRQWSEATAGEALVVVRGAQHYVSPRWMPSFGEHGQVVPTWNYLTVHVHGDLIAHDDPAWVEDVVRRLTRLHETAYDVDDVPPDYLVRQLRAIVGLELRITRIEAKAKMSQNKMPDDVSGIVAGLRADTGADDGHAGPTAAWMERHSLPAARRRAALLADVARRRRPRSEEPGEADAITDDHAADAGSDGPSR